MYTIILREIEESDLDRINRWRNDKNLIESLGSPFRYIGLHTDRLWYEKYLNLRSNNVRLAIILKEKETHIGNIYLLDINWIDRTANFALFIGDKEHQGLGFGTAATKLLLAHAKNDLNLRQIRLEVIKNNEKAIEMYKKLGFIEEGLKYRAIYKNNVYVDVVIMRLDL